MSIEDRNRVIALEKLVASLQHDVVVLVNAMNQISGAAQPNDKPNVRDLSARVTALEGQRVKR